MRPDPKALMIDVRYVPAARVAVWLIASWVILTQPFFAQAGDRYWDGANAGSTGDGASDGGTAVWDTTTLNWDQGVGVDRVNWTNANNDTAIFGGTAGTVSLSTGITVGGLQFDAAAYVVQDNTLTFGTAGIIRANEDATISSVLAGSAAISKAGAGILTLSGTNTYTGATIISNGTLRAGSAAAFNNTSALTITAGAGVLDLNGYDARFTASTLFSASASITDNSAGGGTSTINVGDIGNNAINTLIKDGPTRSVAVRVRLSNVSNFGNGANTFSGGLTLLNSSRLRLFGIVPGAYGTGPIYLGETTNDSATLFFATANQTLTNDLVFNSPPNTFLPGLRVDVTNLVLSGTITANLAPISFSTAASGSALLTGQLTGPEGLEVFEFGSGLILTLSNAAEDNDYQGDTVLPGMGTFSLGAANQIPNGVGTGDFVNNGTLNMNGFSEAINGLSGTGVVDGVSGTPTLTVGDNDATGAFSGVIKNTAGTLSLTKVGNGTLTLSGVNTYAGPTTVSAGKLMAVTGGSCSNSEVTVASGATLGASVLTVDGQWSCGTLTLDSGTTTAEFDYVAAPGNTVAPIRVNGDLVNNGTLTVSIAGDGFLVGVSYPLIQYTGSATIGALATNLPAGIEGELVHNTTNKTIDLNVTSGDLLVWSAGTGIWDINTSSNWNLQSSTYTEGSNLRFDDTPAGAGPFTVTLNTNVNPGGVLFDHDSKAYTIAGGGAIEGTTALNKSGTGLLTLAVTNTYTGATIINEGTLKAGSAGGLSTNSIITVAGGAVLDLGGFDNTILDLTNGTATSVITDSSAPGSGGTLKISTGLGNTARAHLFTGSLGLDIFGGELVVHLSNTNSTYSGGTIFGASTIGTRWLGSGLIGEGTGGNVTKGRFGTGTITMGTATNHSANFYFAGATTINNNTIVNTARSAEGAFRAESSGNVIAGSIMANLDDVVFTAWNFPGRTINVTGQIFGPSGARVHTGNNGGVTVTLSNTGAPNSYAGDTVISGNSTGVLALGAADQIPNGAGKGNLVVTAGAFNMAGFSETVNGLSGTGIVEGGSGTPTLTVGDNDATSTFSGVLQNSAGTLALTKIGAGVLTLSGVNAYTGITTINAGTLALAAPGSISSSPLISVEAGATFDAGPGFTLGTGQTLSGEGTVVSAIEVDGAVSPGIGGIGTLTASNTVTWNAGVAWPYEVGAASASDRLRIDGDFTMGTGGEGEFAFDLQNSAVAGVYTLVTWTASTTFDDGTEFSVVNLPGGLTPGFIVGANELLLTLTSDGGGGFSAGSTNASIALVSGQVVFGFNIASGALYRVQASTNLLADIDNGFVDIAGPLTNFQAGTILYTNGSPDPSRAFRIKSP